MHKYRASVQCLISMIIDDKYTLNLSLPAILVSEDADGLLQSLLSLLHITLLSFTVRLLCNPTACAKKHTHKRDPLHKEIHSRFLKKNEHFYENWLTLSASYIVTPVGGRQLTVFMSELVNHSFNRFIYKYRIIQEHYKWLISHPLPHSKVFIRCALYNLC